MIQPQLLRLLSGACPLFAFVICILLASAGYGQVPYDRSLYEHWTDDDTDCQNTREEVLIAESMSPVELDENGCKVLRGRWFDPLHRTHGERPFTVEMSTISYRWQRPTAVELSLGVLTGAEPSPTTWSTRTG